MKFIWSARVSIAVGLYGVNTQKNKKIETY